MTRLFAAEPGAPTKLHAFDLTRTSLNLSWSAPRDDGGAPLLGYVVEKRSPYSPRWTRINRKPFLDTSLYYSDLPEGDEYEFRVLAVNAAGPGTPSDPTPLIKIKDPYGQHR